MSETEVSRDGSEVLEFVRASVEYLSRTLSTTLFGYSSAIWVPPKVAYATLSESGFSLSLSWVPSFERPAVSAVLTAGPSELSVVLSTGPDVIGKAVLSRPAADRELDADLVAAQLAHALDGALTIAWSNPLEQWEASQPGAHDRVSCWMQLFEVFVRGYENLHRLPAPTANPMTGVFSVELRPAAPIESEICYYATTSTDQNDVVLQAEIDLDGEYIGASHTTLVFGEVHSELESNWLLDHNDVADQLPKLMQALTDALNAALADLPAQSA